jgi:acyl-coenzyme A synthetase/AMP-(fatty) acid ligase
VIVPQDGVAPDEDLINTLRTFCREQLAGFKVPRSCVLTDAHPPTGTGKIKKSQVRAPHWEGHDRAI